MSPNKAQTKPKNLPLHKPVPVLGTNLEGVAEVLTLYVLTVQELVPREEFPAPRLFSHRRARWLIREVEGWRESRPVSTLPPPPNTGAKKSRPSRAERSAAA